MQFKVSKVVLATATAIAALAGTNANAQWAVVNMNDEVYFGNMGVVTSELRNIKRAIDASTVRVMGAVNKGSSATDVARQQDYQAIQLNDMRNRAAIGQANVANNIAQGMPDLEACAVITSRMGFGMNTDSAGGAANRSGAKPAASRTEDAKSNLNKMAAIVNTEDKVASGTCSADDVKYKICKTTGDYGGHDGKDGKGVIPPSDANANAIMGNTSKAAKGGKVELPMANKTLAPEGVAVGNKYITNAIIDAKPNNLTDKQKQMPEAKEYYAVKQTADIRVNAATTALENIMAKRVPLKDLSTSSNEDWKNANYTQITGMEKPPGNPSLDDYMHVKAFGELFGMLGSKPPSGQDALLQNINKQLALTNAYLARQVEQQEITNSLLSHLLMQELKPVDYGKIDAIYNKINLKQPTK